MANSVNVEGGALWCEFLCAPSVTQTTFHGHVSPNGGGFYIGNDCTVSIANSILAFATEGKAVTCENGGEATLACCDIYGNAGGDWVDEIADQLGVNGNISADPLFCAPEMEDFSLHENSPCAPYSDPNPECDLIGALPVQCGPTPTRVRSWGSIKATFSDRRKSEK